MLKHIVLFKFKGNQVERREAAEKFKEALTALPSQIDSLKEIEVGINCNPAEKWDLSLMAVTENMDALAEYASHPLHVKAVGLIKDKIEDRACVDYFE